jgi:hypothetical protein
LHLSLAEHITADTDDDGRLDAMELSKTQTSLLSPSTPTNVFEERQGPQVWAVDLHAWRFKLWQFGALLQLTLLTTAERVEMACFVPSALLVANAS